MITVFTPTYNRSYILSKLYLSLTKQTNKDFEWLIVDDGSTDNTKETVKSFQYDNRIQINYYYQENGGKHRAINNGINLANGELFFIVDSDDFLVDNAIERIIIHYNDIKDNPEFGGVCGLRAYPSGIRVGENKKIFSVLDCSSLEFRYKYDQKGDMAEVYYTKVLKEYPFPEFYNEKFCSEAVVWNRIACKYKLRFFYEIIYICEYLPDGLSAFSYKQQRNSPYGTKLYYKELLSYNIPMYHKIKNTLIYWRCMLFNKNSFYWPLWVYILYPLGLVYAILADLKINLRSRLK